MATGESRSRDRALAQDLKKGSGVPTVTYAEALDVALCWGWIDGLKKSFDDVAFLQRFSRDGRRASGARSTATTSPVGQSRAHDAAWPAAGGRRETDGRWDAAYAPIRLHRTVPEDLREAINANARAFKTFRTLNRQNLFALTFRTNNMKTPAGRAKKIADLVAMLARGETIAPQRLREPARYAFGVVPSMR